MCFVTSAKNVIFFMSVACAGLGVSTIFPSVLLFTSKYIKITGKVGAMFYIVSALGGMTSVALVGLLFESYGHMWLPYVCLISSMLFSLIYVAVNIVLAIMNKQHKKHARESQL
jgi:fucose permease